MFRLKCISGRFCGHCPQSIQNVNFKLKNLSSYLNEVNRLGKIDGAQESSPIFPIKQLKIVGLNRKLTKWKVLFLRCYLDEERCPPKGKMKKISEFIYFFKTKLKSSLLSFTCCKIQCKCKRKTILNNTHFTIFGIFFN